MKKQFKPARARVAALVLTAAAALLAGGTAVAQPHRHPGPWHGDIHRFHEHDWGVWRGGHWYHGRHGGRLGWWWIAGGTFYLYPTPVYPYPSPWEPPPAVLPAPPVEAAPPPTQYWYYCPAANGYYPYVATCPGGWQQVPATPSQ